MAWGPYCYLVLRIPFFLTLPQPFAKKLPKEHVLSSALPVYIKLAADDQDSVRLLTVQDLIVIAQHLEPEEVKAELLQQLRQSVTDKSWRVRYMVANHFVEVRVVSSTLHPRHEMNICNSWRKQWVKILCEKNWSEHSFSCSRITRPKCGRRVLDRFLVRYYFAG